MGREPLQEVPRRRRLRAKRHAGCDAYDPRGADLAECRGATCDGAGFVASKGEFICAGSNVRGVGEVALAEGFCGHCYWEGCCCEGEQGGGAGEVHFLEIGWIDEVKEG